MKRRIPHIATTSTLSRWVIETQNTASDKKKKDPTQEKTCKNRNYKPSRRQSPTITALKAVQAKQIKGEDRLHSKLHVVVDALQLIARGTTCLLRST